MIIYVILKKRKEKVCILRTVYLCTEGSNYFEIQLPLM